MSCERCGSVDGLMVYSDTATETTRNFVKVLGYFPYEVPLNLCLRCALAQDSFLGNMLMLSIERNFSTGRHSEIKEAEKTWAEDAKKMLALLWVARDSMDLARRILTEDEFVKIKPWLEQGLSTVHSARA